MKTTDETYYILTDSTGETFLVDQETRTPHHWEAKRFNRLEEVQSYLQHHEVGDFQHILEIHLHLTVKKVAQGNEKIYHIRAPETLFNKWMKFREKDMAVAILGGGLIQNDYELTSEHLNQWYKEITQHIQALKGNLSNQDIQMLMQLRNQTVQYIKETNP